MELSATVAALRRDIAALARLGADAAGVGEQISAALEPPVTLRLIELLGEVAEEVTAQLPVGRAVLRVGPRETAIVLENGPAPELDLAAQDAASRISLRLPDELKRRLDMLADREGVSTNSWVVRALSRAVAAESAPPRHGGRLRGRGVS